MSRVLFFSDAHLDWVTGGLERFDEVSRALDQVYEHARDNPVDVAVFGGDLCDPDVDSPLAHRAIARAVEFGLALERYAKTMWLVGNHDVIEDGRGSHTLMALAKAGLNVYAEPATVLVGDVGFVLLPYASASRRYDPARYVNAVESPWDESGHCRVRRWVVAGHMTRVPGISHGSETADMPRGSDMDFPLAAVRSNLGEEAVCLNGHFHARCTTGPVLVPGSLARLTHGEEGNVPGFLVVEA